LTKPSLNKEKSTSTLVVSAGSCELREELESLNHLNIGPKLKLKHLPNKNTKLHGEVKGDYLLVYDEDEKSALATLRHEFLDYAISKTIEPYEKIANKLIELLNEEAYLKKERLVEALQNYLFTSIYRDTKKVLE
jgi:hypothetical protein